MNLNCRELLRKQIEESNSLENISLNENLELLKNKRTDISLLELTQESIPLSNKIFNTKKEIEKEQHNTIKDKNNINDNKNNINNNVKDNDYSNNNFDFIKKKIENTFNNNNNNNIKEEENLNNESYDENLHNLHRIEKIENILGLINGNVNFINLELKSIKNSLIKKRKTNFIKQKKNRIYQDDRINNAEKVELITSEAVLREIEKLKTGQNNNSNFKNKNLENENHERENNKKDNSNFKKTNQDTRSLLQIKSFNDLHIDLNSLGKNKNAEKDNNNNNKNDNKTNSAKINKDNKQMQDLNDIIEGFKKKQASEERNIDKKKFHKQVTLNDKEEVK